MNKYFFSYLNLQGWCLAVKDNNSYTVLILFCQSINVEFVKR